jgi:hypothetical protein
MGYDENLMRSFQILPSSIEKTMQDVQTKGTIAQTPNL